MFIWLFYVDHVFCCFQKVNMRVILSLTCVKLSFVPIYFSEGQLSGVEKILTTDSEDQVGPKQG